MPALWTTTSTPPCFSRRWWAMRCGASGAVMSRTSQSPLELGHHGLQLARGLRYVDATTTRAVTVQHPRDRLADAAAGAGHQGDLAGQRAVRVGDLAGRADAAVGADPHDLPRDVRRLGREQEAQRRGDLVLGAGRDLHELDRAALADLLAEAAGEALEGALGDPLGTGDQLGRRAEDDDPGVWSRGRASAGRRSRAAAPSRSLEVSPVASKTRPRSRAAVGRRLGGARMARPSRSPGRESTRRPLTADEHRAGHQRRALDVAGQWGRAGQAEVLDEDPADGGGGELLVAVTHGTPCN